MLIRYHSWAHRPPHRVSCRLIDRHGGVVASHEGRYIDSTWLFLVEEEPEWTHAHLVLDGQVTITESDKPTESDLDLDQTDNPVVAPIYIDDGRLQQTWFTEAPVDEDRWDVVVVGTGIGGGTLLSALTALAAKRATRDQSTLKILGLEAGSLLFPVHAANLPREVFRTNETGATSMWNSLESFGTQPYQPPLPDNWNGYEVFAFGGRSLYWGGLCPRPSSSEMMKWPPAIAQDLTQCAYGDPAYLAQAETMLEVGSPEVSPLQADAIQLLRRLFDDRITASAPVAARIEPAGSWRLASGMFSTAELLLQQRLSNTTNGQFGQPYIHLGELVLGVEQHGKDWLVHGVDLRDGAPVTRRTRKVVLCAGTVESARILHASKLPEMSGLAGQGLTEHPMAYVHFQVPAGNRFCVPDTSAKVLTTPGTANDDWNMQLELGADLNEGRWLPPGAVPDQTTVSPGAIAGQLVFFGAAPLGGGYVQFDDNTPWLNLDQRAGRTLPAVTLNLPPAGTPAEWQGYADAVLRELDAEPLPKPDQANLVLKPSQSGWVAHHVGTLRIGRDVGNGVVSDDLEVFGYKNLFVCDASVFPRSPAANPSLTITALSLRLADHLVKSGS